MATPIILSTGSISGAGIAGQGRDDLVVGENVGLEDTEPLNVGAAYSWVFEDKPIGSSTNLINPTSATPSFIPDISGSYRVRATVNGTDSSFDILAVPLANTGGRIPSFEEEEGYDEAGNTKGWHEAMTVWMRAVDALLGSGSAAIYERRVESAVAEGSDTTEQTTGNVSYPGSILGLAAKIEEAVIGGTVTINCKVEGATTLTVVLDGTNPTRNFVTEVPGVHTFSADDEITVEIVAASYDNAANVVAGISVNVVVVASTLSIPLETQLTLTDVKIANYTAGVGERVLVDPTSAGFDVTMPVVTGINKGDIVAVKNQSDSVNPVQVLPDAGHTIDGQPGFTMTGAREAQNFQYDGVSDWLII